MNALRQKIIEVLKKAGTRGKSREELILDFPEILPQTLTTTCSQLIKLGVLDEAGEERTTSRGTKSRVMIYSPPTPRDYTTVKEALLDFEKAAIAGKYNPQTIKSMLSVLRNTLGNTLITREAALRIINNKTYTTDAAKEIRVHHIETFYHWLDGYTLFCRQGVKKKTNKIDKTQHRNPQRVLKEPYKNYTRGIVDPKDESKISPTVLKTFQELYKLLITERDNGWLTTSIQAVDKFMDQLDSLLPSLEEQ